MGRDVGGDRWVRLAAALVGFAIFGTCSGLVPSLVPGVGEPVFEPPDPRPAEPEPNGAIFRVRRLDRASSPPGWLRFAPGDASFTVLGPGRPTQDVSSRGGRYTFVLDDDVELVAEVRNLLRGRRNVPRRVLEPETERFLAKIGAVERSRSWSGFGPRLELVVDGHLADASLRLRTFLEEGRVFRAWAVWRSDPDDEASAAIEAFVLGLRAGVSA